MKSTINLCPAINSLLILLVLCSGCNNDGEWKDEGIKPKVRKELAALNDLVISTLKSRKPHNLELLCSDSLMKFRKEIPKIMTASFLSSINNHRFQIQNQFQINGKPGSIFTLRSSTDEHGYTVRFQSYAHENLVTFGYFEDSLQSIGMLAIWCKFPEGWRLNGLRFAPYKILGEDAIFWYGKALAEYNDDDIIDASIHLSLALEVIKPAEDYFIYDKEPAIRSLVENIQGPSSRMYKLPFEMTSLPVRPVLFKITPCLYQRKCVPAFLYKTHFPLNDTAALARECDAIHEEARKIFKGTNERNKVHVYRAFIREPLNNDLDQSYYYEMVRTNDRYHWYNND